jgi:hypothetical protein
MFAPASVKSCEVAATIPARSGQEIKRRDIAPRFALAATSSDTSAGYAA